MTLTVLQKRSSVNTLDFISTRIEDTWPKTREKEEAKTKAALRAAASRPVCLGAKAREKQLRIVRTTRRMTTTMTTTTTQLGLKILVKHTMTPLDGDDVQHEHDDEHDTSGSHTAVDTANAFEAAELGAIALLANTWDVDFVSDPELSAQLVQATAQAPPSVLARERGETKAKRRANVLFAHHTYHCKTVVDE